MSKTVKYLIGLVAVGTAIGAGVTLAAKHKLFDCLPQWDDEAEDEDFDLDEDLDIVKDREYVPLRSVSPEPTDDVDDTTSDEVDTDED